MFEFDDVALDMAGDGEGGTATGARVRADEFSGLAFGHQKLRPLHALLHASNIDGFALGAHHRDGVVRLQGVGLFLGLDFCEHRHVFSGLHGFHVLGADVAGQPSYGGDCQGDDKKSQTIGGAFCGFHFFCWCWFCLMF